MREQRLLERIRSQEVDPQRRWEENPTAITQSVLRHLERILNTRQGSAMISEEYGVPDFTDLAGSFTTEAVREMERAITEVIRLYEPRLTKVAISAEPRGDDLLNLRFKIEGQLALERTQVPISIETIVDPDGRIKVGE